MSKGLKKCALILARGGSKSVPRKNLVKLDNIPLIYYPIVAARESCLQDVWVSSEDSEILNTSVKFKAKTHFRNANLSLDLTEDIDCFKEFIAENNSYDYIVHLRATSPQINSNIINSAIDLFEEKYEDIDSLRSVIRSEVSPFKMWFIDRSGILSPAIKGNNYHSSPRQILEQSYSQNACIDIVKCSTIINKNSMVGDVCLSYVMENLYDIDIDTFQDLEIAKKKIRK